MPERVGEGENEIVFNGYIISLFNNALRNSIRIIYFIGKPGVS
jgi:hypothetical protein